MLGKYFVTGLLSLFLLSAPAAAGQPDLPNVDAQCASYLKPGDPDHVDQYLCRDGYVAGYDYTSRQAAWVAYRLTGKKVSKHLERHDHFEADEAIPDKYQATLDDYHHSGYDRGHLAPYAAMDFNRHSARQSFLLSNIAPQTPRLNRQLWRRLESDVRFWARAKKQIYVRTGPIYKKQTPASFIGDGVAVPDYFFKIIYAPKQNQAIAFVMPNRRKIKDLKPADYRTSIKAIQQRTGLKFLTNVPDQQRQSLIEGVAKMWRTEYKK